MLYNHQLLFYTHWTNALDKVFFFAMSQLPPDYVKSLRNYADNNVGTVICITINSLNGVVQVSWEMSRAEFSRFRNDPRRVDVKSTYLFKWYFVCLLLICIIAAGRVQRREIRHDWTCI